MWGARRVFRGARASRPSVGASRGDLSLRRKPSDVRVALCAGKPSAGRLRQRPGRAWSADLGATRARGKTAAGLGENASPFAAKASRSCAEASSVPAKASPSSEKPSRSAGKASRFAGKASPFSQKARPFSRKPSPFSRKASPFSGAFRPSNQSKRSKTKPPKPAWPDDGQRRHHQRARPAAVASRENEILAEIHRDRRAPCAHDGRNSALAQAPAGCGGAVV